MDLDAKKAIIRKMRSKLAVGEVFCTRIVKGSNGSVLVGLTATIDANATPEEAALATLLLGSEVDQLAYDRAIAGSVITVKDHTVASQKTKANYTKLLAEALDRLEKAQASGTGVPKLRTGTNG